MTHIGDRYKHSAPHIVTYLICIFAKICITYLQKYELHICRYTTVQMYIVYCTVLYCTVLYCTVLYCTV